MPTVEKMHRVITEIKGLAFTMVLVFFRRESPSVGWLVEEFLRRLTRRKSAETIPSSSEIFLTRASDGAELFGEDAIMDILVDNDLVS